MRLTFRAKLLASHVGLVAAVLLIVIFELNRALGDDLRRQLNQRLEEQAVGAAQWINAGRHPDRLAGRLAVVVGAQVTIMDRSGNVVGDSESPGTPEMDNQAGQPEVVSARLGNVGHANRVSPRTSEEMHYVAVPAGDDLVVRLAVPLSGIEGTLRSMRARLLFASALAVAAALALGLVASRIAAGPLRQMTRSATRIAEGDYDIDVASSSPDEFGVLSRSLASLAGQLKGRIGDLTAERDRLSAILAGMAEGVLVTGADGEVIIVNPAAQQILGTKEALLGRRFDEAVPLSSLRELIERATETGDTHEADTVPSHSGGRFLAVYVRPLAREAGGGVVAVMRDMTEMRRFETMRRDFVANVSHELRTPATAIQGYAETMLRGTADPATAKQFLEIIHRHAQRLSGLLEDLLRLSALEARPPEQVVLEPVAIRGVADNVVQTVRERTDATRARIVIEVTPDTIALADPGGLEQVLENLVDNALKYGKDGGTIRIEGKRKRDRVVLSVVDDGPGIAEEHLGRVFERFYRVDPGRSRERGGTGLGLAIVKHLAESMGGAVSVESEVGKGCRFEITLARVSERAAAE